MHSAGLDSRARTSKILDTLVASDTVTKIDGGKYQITPMETFTIQTVNSGKIIPVRTRCDLLTLRKSFDQNKYANSRWGKADLTKVDDYHKVPRSTSMQGHRNGL